MPRLSELIDATKTVAVAAGDMSVEITFRVFWESGFDEGDWKRLNSVAGREYFAEVLPRMLTTWDIVDGDGAAVPVTQEAIEQHDLPVRFLAECERAVLAAGSWS